jgi:nitric oxide reductase NorE protein
MPDIAVERAVTAGDFERTGTPSSGYVPGASSMWFFILGDLLIFGVYFVCFMAYRAQDRELFLHSQQHLNQGVGAINTVVLLSSSLFVALGTEAARAGHAALAFRLIAGAFALGLAFPLLKLVEWIPKIMDGITPGENLFFMFYYLMTGLHLVHVLLGLVILGFVLRDLQRSTTPNITFVETGATYWHMVDLLWLLLFALFYLLR